VLRLILEPRRLYRRYLLKYPKFVFQFIKHSLGFKVRP
jgi:UDP-N-acetyl-D-mannosaminuronic acid transferase (WecB/TagA/CpsF family)